MKEVVLPKSLFSASGDIFEGCDALERIYFEGTLAEWNPIQKLFVSLPKDSKEIVFLYSEDEPTSTGKYWHYVDGAPTAWETFSAESLSVEISNVQHTIRPC